MAPGTGARARRSRAGSSCGARSGSPASAPATARPSAASHPGHRATAWRSRASAVSALCRLGKPPRRIRRRRPSRAGGSSSDRYQLPWPSWPRCGQSAPIRLPVRLSRQPHQLYTHPREVMTLPFAVSSSCGNPDCRVDRSVRLQHARGRRPRRSPGAAGWSNDRHADDRAATGNSCACAASVRAVLAVARDHHLPRAQASSAPTRSPADCRAHPGSACRAGRGSLPGATTARIWHS